ncbi:oxidoreductase C-terminal domain-containing protein [Rhodococcus gannanensis]|uniref:Oxidoreductase C-terminal domain-containing protein n=1 Tax=Rhodococcus gannanensis TaxID=1960308 RepID=A0ABW4PCJ8_9NOCA
MTRPRFRRTLSPGNLVPLEPEVPYFWSDQYDVKIQSLGDPTAADTVHVVEDDGRRFLAYYARDGRLCAAVGGGRPRPVMQARTKIAASVPIDEVVTTAV